MPIPADVTNYPTLLDSVSQINPNIVVHLAAMTDVDWCEKNAKEAEFTNYRGTINAAQACDVVKAKMVLLSSDHVFDGVWGRYKENSKQHPVNTYGFTKMAAEAAMQAFPSVRIIRTSKNFTYDELDGRFINGWADFPTFIRRSFIWNKDFVYTLLNYLVRYDEMPKILHLSARTVISWYDFAQRYAEVHGLFKGEVKKHIMARRNDDVTYAPRPHNGGLNVNLALGLGFRLPSTYESLENSIKDK